MKIEYRKVTPEEKLYIVRLQGFVFSSDVNEIVKEIREHISKGEYKSDNTYGAIDENGRVLAGMEVIPYVMWFDGHKVPMYGIGGVASLPESRRQSNIRHIFEKAFDDIYEKGAVFSHLFPFSHDYYRKFGYEYCGAAKKYKLSTEYARKLKNNGSAHEFIKSGENDEAYDKLREKLIDVYELYASRHNIMLSRTESQWKDIFNIDIFGADRLYYWKDAEKNVKSWIKFKKDGDTMQVIDIAWADHESMLGILQFMGMFEGAADNLSLNASPEFIPDLYWNDIYDIEEERKLLGMNRVVDAKRALELIKKDDVNEGKFSVKVTDDFARWNNNVYSVEYGGGDCRVKTSAANTDADIEVSERALMQIVLGVFELEQISRRDDVRINSNISVLKKIFHRKNLHIADQF